MDKTEKSVVRYILGFYHKGVICEPVETVATLSEATGFSEEDIKDTVSFSSFLTTIGTENVGFTIEARAFLNLVKEDFNME